MVWLSRCAPTTGLTPGRNVFTAAPAMSCTTGMCQCAASFAVRGPADILATNHRRRSRPRHRPITSQRADAVSLAAGLRRREPASSLTHTADPAPSTTLIDSGATRRITTRSRLARVHLPRQQVRSLSAGESGIRNCLPPRIPVHRLTLTLYVHTHTMLFVRGNRGLARFIVSGASAANIAVPQSLAQRCWHVVSESERQPNLIAAC